MGNSSDTRRFEYKDEKSSKFWEISVADKGFTVRYGKIGTDGQTQIKEFADAATAEKQAQKLIAEKVGKGYLEVGHEQPPTAVSSSAEAKKEASSLIDSSLSHEEKLALAKSPDMAAEILEALADDEEQRVPKRYQERFELRHAIARNANCSLQLLEKLHKFNNAVLRGNIARNPNCPLPLLKKWSVLKDENTRASVAMNPSSPVSLLEVLSRDDDNIVRWCLARNPACPVEILTGLGSDPCELVLRAVASNSHTPLAILEKLAAHSENDIRFAVAGNQACPVELQKVVITIPKCCFPTNDSLASVMEPVRELKRLIEKARSEFPDHPLLDDNGIKDIDFCAPAWCLKLFKIPTQYADRTRSMLEGPFFTSKKYPWPSGENTKYASPVVQLDLREVSILKKQDYGDGLLQVFLSDFYSGFDVRVIPRSDVVESQMTPFPEGGEDEFFRDLTPKYWLGNDGTVSQIIGYEEPVLSADVFVSRENKDDDPAIFKDIFEKMQYLDMNASGAHMFGTFSAIQYRHSEMGGELLMALDDSSVWSDTGNAQIFVDRGAVDFSAMWAR